MDILKGMEFGVKTYINQGAFGALKMINKSNFGQQDIVFSLFSIVTIILLLTISTVFGIIAVRKICPGNDSRSQNVRIGLYALIFFTSGQISWIYILLWMLGIKF